MNINQQRNIQKNINELRRIIDFLKHHNMVYENKNVVMMMLDTINDVGSATTQFIQRHKDILLADDDKCKYDIPLPNIFKF